MAPWQKQQQKRRVTRIKGNSAHDYGTVAAPFCRRGNP
jgi:hypothetical protein